MEKYEKMSTKAKEFVAAADQSAWENYEVPDGWSWTDLRGHWGHIMKDMGAPTHIRSLRESSSRWGGRHAGYVYGTLIPSHILAKKDKIVSAYQDMLISQKKALESQKTKEQKEGEIAAKLAKKQAKEKMTADLAQLGLPDDKYSGILFGQLRDIHEADSDWLTDAYRALRYSMQNRGIMSTYFSDEGCEMDFYESLGLAIHAHRRHTQTNYDQLLRDGCDRETARDLITF